MKEFKYRLECVKYTLNHKRAFLKVEKKLLGKNTLKGYLHDIDKVLMYPIFGKEITSRYHRRNRAHHVESNKYKTKKDFIESAPTGILARQKQQKCTFLFPSPAPTLLPETKYPPPSSNDAPQYSIADACPHKRLIGQSQ